MTLSTDHRAVAAALIAITADEAQLARAATRDLTLVTSAATAHALLALESRLGELVEQQRISNVIAALAMPLGQGLITSGADLGAAATYVRAHIGDIVNPDPTDDLS